MLARLIGRQSGRQGIDHPVDTGGARADIRRFEVLSGSVAGAAVLVFLDPQGVATAVETTEAGTQILTGVAAGAALSDVREAAEAPGADSFSPRALTAGETTRFVSSLEGLNQSQKAQLKGALAL